MARGFRGFKRNKGGGNPFVPFEQTFAYTGNVQTLQVPTTGLYQLEVWGGQGGGSGGAGGYSKGYKFLKKNTTLYIVVGGQGTIVYQYGKTSWAGGYNGGGSASGSEDYNSGLGGSGGGATHIALVTGTLAAIGITDFVDNGNGLIVAGGGGGNASSKNNGEWVYNTAGGSGGGTNGGNGAYGYYVSAGGGGTQTGGGSAGSGDSYCQAGTFGQGGSMGNYGAGGGGGFYGGGSSKAYTFMCSAAGGGSGWIGGVPEITYKGTTYTPGTSNGVRTGHGQAKITRVV